MPPLSTAIERPAAGYATPLLLAAALAALATFALGAASTAARAADLRVLVKDAAGRPVEDAVVVAVGANVPAAAVQAARGNDIIDQIDAEFAPRVKPVMVGSSVTFPNKDNVRHQVYSFSPAKTFELPLYAGTPARPVLFDRPGVVVLGCNIHDWMVGYVYVSESPWFAKTGTDGSAVLRGLPPQRYGVRAWHPRLQGDESATRQEANLQTDLQAESTAALSFTVRLRPDVRIRRAPVAGSHSHY